MNIMMMTMMMMEVLHCENRNFRPFCSCDLDLDLDLDPMTFISSYANFARIPLRYAGCANMNFLRQCLRKLDRQADTTKIIYDAASWVDQ